MDNYINSLRYELHYFNEGYKTVKDFAPVFNHPFLIFQKILPLIEGITYRQINSWEQEDLISGTRQNDERGWRKFSLIDVIKLQLIADLRNNGVSIKRIKSILDKISNATFTLSITAPPEKIRQEKIKFFLLEYALVRVTNGEKIIALIDDADEVLLQQVDKALVYYSGIWQAYPLTLILPFWRYAKNLGKLSNKDIPMKEKSSLANLLIKLQNTPTTKEQKILDIVKDKAYDEITLKKRNNDEILIRAKRRTSGDFSDKDIVDLINQKNYQSVTVITDKGKRVALIQEESIKV